MNQHNSERDATINNSISGLWTLESSTEHFGKDYNSSASSLQIKEELRLDIDGNYPQKAASGTWRLNNFYVHWVAKLQEVESNSWTGHIWYKDGDISQFPYTSITIKLEGITQQTAKLMFTSGDSFTHTSYYKRQSPYFHPVEFEYDSEDGVMAVTSIQTHAHPNHPHSLPNETLSIETVYRRAGFDVGLSSGASTIPISEAGLDIRWSDAEMHDAMQQHWSEYSESARWALWVFFASLHEDGPSLGGIMFDSIGSQHRQGTAIFNRSFITKAPERETHPEAWVQRMKFWTACHEIGHGFNLAHSWQKAMGTPWMPLENEPEARSFMNYPYSVQGGEKTFFENFEYRFSNDELLFLRHAPERFVKMGDAEWFDHHGFEQHNVLQNSSFKLDIRVNRETTRYEFLEPVVIELKMTNNTTEPHIINKNLLSDFTNMTVIVKKHGKVAKQILPYVRYIQQPENIVIPSGQSIYQSLFVSVGKEGWIIAEPGDYLIQVALHLKNEDIVSKELRIRVEPPMDRVEDFLAQDLFSDEIGRILYFDGSQYFKKGNDVLRTITEQIPHRKVSIHAQVALSLPMTKYYKKLGARKTIQISPPKLEEAKQILFPSLVEQSYVAANTLGHIDYKYYMEQFSNAIAFQYGQPTEAAVIQKKLYQTLTDRNVKADVLQEIKEKEEKYASMANRH
ncbi:hypothetical protein [Pelosinus baikalensis]|uniref:Peptidase M60 domain-containing protein n=1 Tax=Pelosinus baikalensis TaxID=2892015 RepID=A0ABS8HPR6_9FIRM|nr:hypothetical protein [Pelosinus baikalensis]MCC5464564.1 hypothetical protein [Pelosinus baikalensis]